MKKEIQQPLDECVFVILGATGDLTKRKLIPALYKLIASGTLSHFALVGVSLTHTTMQQVLALARPYITDINQDVWQKLEAASYYHQMDFHDQQAYASLQKLLNQIEEKHKFKGHRLFYFATMPQHFAVITENLAKYKIAQKHHKGHVTEKGTWTRVVYEKPFGFDLKSARQINRAIAQVFDEKQVFRIDHYLGKELVGNIALSRFTNQVFEPLWNKQYIDSVQIILSEDFGIEGRGAFYDSYGALKDVVQNHVLQILALIAMEVPEKFTAEHLRDLKAKVLAKVKVESVLLGQYEGYHQEKDVRPDSKTETFAALKVTINNRRWKGIPFYIKAGKYLNKEEASVHIKFKMVRCLLNFCPMDSNYLTINIQPDEGFYLELNAKEPGVFDRVVPVKMNFSHSALFGPNTPAAYEVLLADVIRGDHFAFVRADEIELSWKIIEQIEKIKGHVYLYQRGSAGPNELTKLDPTRPIRWRI